MIKKIYIITTLLLCQTIVIPQATTQSTSSSKDIAALPATTLNNHHAFEGFTVINFPLDFVSDIFTKKIFADIDTTFGKKGIGLDQNQITHIKKTYLYMIFLIKLDKVQNNPAYAQYQSDFSEYLQDNGQPQPHIPSETLVQSVGWNAISVTASDLQNSRAWQLFCKSMICDVYIYFFTVLQIIHNVEKQTFNYIPHFETSYYNKDYTNLRMINEITRTRLVLEETVKQRYIDQSLDWQKLPTVLSLKKSKTNKPQASLEQAIIDFRSSPFYKETHDKHTALDTQVYRENSEAIPNSKLLGVHRLSSPQKEQIWCYFMLAEAYGQITSFINLENLDTVLKSCQNSTLPINLCPYNMDDYVILEDLLAAKSKIEGTDVTSIHPTPPTFQIDQIRKPEYLGCPGRNMQTCHQDIMKKVTAVAQSTKESQVQAQSFLSFFKSIGHDFVQAGEDIAHGVESAAKAVEHAAIAVGQGIAGVGAIAVGGIAHWFGNTSISDWGNKEMTREQENFKKSVSDLNNCVDNFGDALKDGVVGTFSELSGLLVGVILDDQKIGHDIAGAISSVADTIVNVAAAATKSLADLALDTGQILEKEAEIGAQLAVTVVDAVWAIFSEKGREEFLKDGELLGKDCLNALVEGLVDLKDMAENDLIVVLNGLGAIVNAVTTVFIDLCREVTFLFTNPLALIGLLTGGPLGMLIGGDISNLIGPNKMTDFSDHVRSLTTNTLEANRSTINQVLGVVVCVATDVAVTVATGGTGSAAAVAADAAIMGAAEAAAETTTEVVAENVAEEVGKEAAEEVGKEASEELGKETAKEIAKQAVKDAEKAAQDAAKKALTKAGKKAAMEAGKKLATSAGKEIATTASKEIAANATKEMADQALEEVGNAKQALEDATKELENASSSAAKKAAKAAVKAATKKLAQKEAAAATAKEVALIVAKKAAESAAQDVADAAADVVLKTAARDAAKQALEDATTAEAKEAAEQALTKATKELAEATLKSEAKSAAQQTAASTAKQIAEDATEEAKNAKTALDQAKTIAEEVGKNGTAAEKAAAKEAVKNLAAKFAAKEAAANMEKQLSLILVKEAAKTAAKEAADALSDAAIKDAASVAAKEALEKAVAEGADEATIQSLKEAAENAAEEATTAAAKAEAKTAAKELAEKAAQEAEDLANEGISKGRNILNKLKELKNSMGGKIAGSLAMNLTFGLGGMIGGFNQDQNSMMQEEQQQKTLNALWKFNNENKIAVAQQQLEFLEEIQEKTQAEIGNQALSLALTQNIINANVLQLRSAIINMMSPLYAQLLTPIPAIGLPLANIGTSWTLETDYIDLYPSQGFFTTTTGRTDFPFAQEVAQAPEITNLLIPGSNKGKATSTGPDKLWFNQRCTARDRYDKNKVLKKPLDPLTVQIDFQFLYTLNSEFHVGLYLGGNYHDYNSPTYIQKYLLGDMTIQKAQTILFGTPATLSATQQATCNSASTQTLTPEQQIQCANLQQALAAQQINPLLVDLDEANLAKMVVIYQDSSSNQIQLGVYEHEGLDWILQTPLSSNVSLESMQTYTLKADLSGTNLTISLAVENNATPIVQQTVQVTPIDNQRTYGIICSGAAIQWNQVSPQTKIKKSLRKPITNQTKEIDQEKAIKVQLAQALNPQFGNFKLQKLSRQAILKGQYIYGTAETDLKKIIPSNPADFIIFGINQNGVITQLGSQLSAITPNSDAVIISLITGTVYDRTGSTLQTLQDVLSAYQTQCQQTLSPSLITFITNQQQAIIKALSNVKLQGFILDIISPTALQAGQYIYSCSQTMIDNTSKQIINSSTNKPMTDYLVCAHVEGKNMTIGFAPHADNVNALFSLVTGNVYAKNTPITTNKAPTPMTIHHNQYLQLGTYATAYNLATTAPDYVTITNAQTAYAQYLTSKQQQAAPTSLKPQPVQITRVTKVQPAHFKQGIHLAFKGRQEGFKPHAPGIPMHFAGKGTISERQHEAAGRAGFYFKKTKGVKLSFKKK